jgi:hydrogenase small subunit
MSSLKNKLAEMGISRRDFLKYCTYLSGTLALSPAFAPKIAEAIEADNRPPVIWLNFQDCTGDSESLLRADRPTAAQLVLDYLSIDYHETIMTPSGFQAEKSLKDSFEANKGKYICVVEGSIPTKDGGVYCTIGGKTALEILKEVGGNAAMIICAGSCSSYGGLPAAYPNPTGAKGVMDIIKNKPIVNLPGCPVNVDNLTGTIVNYLLFGTLPALDKYLRPKFAYGKRIHDNCERRAHFDAGQFVEEWSTDAHRQGWCLYKMGCKGPETFHNCPTLRWNGGISWPVQAGHGCAGCSEPGFWDNMGPLYERLPNVPGFGVESTATKIGTTVVAASAVIFGVHGILNVFRNLGTVKKVESQFDED